MASSSSASSSAAVIPASAAPTTKREKPTADLEAALAEFEGVLPEPDRLRLAQVRGRPGMMSDAAMQFTASLDRANSGRRGASVASRFYALLLAVQSFVGVVDTFVSADPVVAALVWGAVKLTMLVAVNFTSYFDELSKAFLDFDKWSPRFNEYSALFPSSTSLQRSICDFHASIVRCCKQVVIMTRRSWQSQLVNALSKLFQAEIQDSIQGIKDKAREVKYEIALAKAQADYWEQKSASKHRFTLSSFVSMASSEIEEARRWRAELDDRKKLEDDERRLDAISTYNHLTAFQQARAKRYQETGGWIFQTAEFEQWQQLKDRNVVWLSGKIGSGKTILSASVIDHLLMNRKESDSIAFFFPRFDSEESLKSETIFRSIIRQNLQRDMVSKLSLKRAEDTAYEAASIVNLLLSKLSLFSTNYIALDALDECEPSDRRVIFDVLSSVLRRTKSTVKIFLSSRNALEDEIMKAFPLALEIRMDAPGVVSDIETYTRQCLGERLDMGQLAVGNTVTLEDICSTLTDGAQGMFLWIALEIEDICSQVCEHDVLLALQDLPETLTETFNRALRRIIKQKKTRIAGDIFKWIAAAKRPLLLAELEEALSIRVGEQYSKPERRPVDIEKVPSWCANLVEIDELSGAVQFAHHTVQTFILDTSLSSPLAPELDEFHFKLEDLDIFVGELSVTYLDWNDFKTALQSFKQPIKLQEPYAVAEAALRTRWDGKAVGKLSRLLRRKKAGGSQRTEPFTPASILTFTGSGGEASSSMAYNHAFLDYASQFWIMHTKKIGKKSLVYKMWAQMVAGGHSTAKTQWTSEEYQASHHSIWSWAVAHQHVALFYTLNYYLADINRVHQPVCSMITSLKSIELLGEYVAVLSTPEVKHRNEMDDKTATMAQMDAVVAYVLSPDEVIIIQDDDGSCAETHWVRTIRWEGSWDTHWVRMIRWEGSWDRLSSQTRDLPPEFRGLAFYASVAYYLPWFMKALLMSDPSLCEAPRWLGRSPLEVAIKGNQVDAVKLLIQRGASPEEDCVCNCSIEKGPDGTRSVWIVCSTVLQLAMHAKDTEIASCLLEAGALVDRLGQNASSMTDKSIFYPINKTKGWDGKVKFIGALTAVHHAILKDNQELTELLLSYGAVIGLKDNHGLSALHWAVASREEALVRRALEGGVNPLIRSSEGEAALDLAHRIKFNTAASMIEKCLDYWGGPSEVVRSRKVFFAFEDDF